MHLNAMWFETCCLCFHSCLLSPRSAWWHCVQSHWPGAPTKKQVSKEQGNTRNIKWMVKVGWSYYSNLTQLLILYTECQIFSFGVWFAFQLLHFLGTFCGFIGFWPSLFKISYAFARRWLIMWRCWWNIWRTMIPRSASRLQKPCQPTLRIMPSCRRRWMCIRHRSWRACSFGPCRIEAWCEFLLVV